MQECLEYNEEEYSCMQKCLETKEIENFMFVYLQSDEEE
jgi:hypothetical protein